MFRDPYTRALMRLVLDKMKQDPTFFQTGDEWIEQWESNRVRVVVRSPDDSQFVSDYFPLCPIEEEETLNQQPAIEGVLSGAVKLIVDTQ